jgi:hypothetical protein
MTRGYAPALVGHQWQVVEVLDGHAVGNVVTYATDEACAFELARLLQASYRAGASDWANRAGVRSVN